MEHGHVTITVTCFMYKVNNVCPCYISDIFNPNNGGYNLRNSDDFSIPRINTTTYGKHSIGYIGPVIWSKLSRHNKNSESIDSFKRQVRKMDIQNLLSEEYKNCHLCNA